jgi:hypothetical protein
MGKRFLYLTGLVLMAPAVLGQSWLSPQNGFRVAEFFPAYASVSAFEILDHALFISLGDTICMLDLQSGEELRRYVVPGDYAEKKYPSFLVSGPGGNALWAGYTSIGNTDDRIYRVDLESGEWQMQARFPGNYDLLFWKDSILVSGLNSASWGDPNGIFVLDTSGLDRHRMLIFTGGNSAGMALDKHQNLLFGTSYSAGQNAIYRWDSSRVAGMLAAPGDTLEIADAVRLTDVPAGVADCHVDDAGHLVFNMNQFGSDKVLARWNGIPGEGYHLDTLALAGGEYDWLGTLRTMGDIQLAVTGNRILTFSFGRPLADVHTADYAPFVANPLGHLEFTHDSQDTAIDLSRVFTDPDDPDSAIIKSILYNSSPELLTLYLQGNTLLVLVPCGCSSSEKFKVLIQGSSGNLTVTDTLAVSYIYPVSAPYISEVLEYIPAPGQFINTRAWGSPASAVSIEGGVNGSLSLGAYGGHVDFRFSEAVENHPDNPYGVDFTIFGNPTPSWSEPGIVWVMEDTNGNGLPDDTWYELAGSDHFFSGTVRDYRVTYTNPGDTVARDVPWQGPGGDSGAIRANTAHTQPYYPAEDLFPGIPREAYSLGGTCLEGAVRTDPSSQIISARRAFGYADNQLRGNAPWTLADNPYTPEVENAGGDAFDISWAVDARGDYVDLDRIHFIRVQTGVLNEGGYLGEVSTEITGAVDVEPSPGINGRTTLAVIRDLPEQMGPCSCQLEVFCFREGRLDPGASFQWTTSADWASVDENQVLRVSGSGSLTLTAALEEEPGIFATVSTYILPTGIEEGAKASPEEIPLLYPNPTSGSFSFRGMRQADIVVMDPSGRVVSEIRAAQENEPQWLSGVPPGIYLVGMEREGQRTWLKLMKQ